MPMDKTVTLQDSSISKQVENCRACPLYQDVVAPVRGEGPKEARVIFIGRNPGNDENRLGRLFVGRAGKKLSEWIESAGLKREDVGFTNLVKCFTPGNRPPSKEEIKTCSSFLKDELKYFCQAEVLVLMGSDVVNTILSLEGKRITDITGNIYKVGRFHIFVMYHPSYVLRNQAEEKRFFNYLAPKMKKLLVRLTKKTLH